MKRFLRTLLEPLRRNGVFDVATAMRKGRVASRTVDGRTVNWLITSANDEIQSRQLVEGFYELSELQQLRADVGERPRVLDVGANIGNHAVFFATMMGCRRLIAIEPFDAAREHLLANLALNAVSALDLNVHPFALGAAEGQASAVPPTAFNIGLTRMNVGCGSIPVVTGDALLAGEAVDLIKIDVEGMEVAVIDGLAQTFDAHRPALFVEVSDDTREAVSQRMAAHGYRLVRATPAYGTQHNLTFLPG